jgi:hypothetical protein
MKTQVFKNSESVKSSNSTMVFTLIIFGTILLFAANKMQTQPGSSSSNLQKRFEYELPLLKMNQTEIDVSSDNNVIDIATADLKFSMEKMYEYLIPDIEPKLEVGKLNSFVFPEFEQVIFISENSLKTDHFLNDLKKQACEKTREATEYCAFEMKLMDYLKAETEGKLEIEDWMLSEMW